MKSDSAKAQVLAPEIEEAVCEAGDTMRMPVCWTEAWAAMRDLARKVVAIERERCAKVALDFGCFGSRGARVSIAAAIRAGGSND